MAVANSIGSKDTLNEDVDKFLKYCMSKDSSKVSSLSIILDSYKQNSIKQMTQLESKRRNRMKRLHHEYETKEFSKCKLVQFSSK